MRINLRQVFVRHRDHYQAQLETKGVSVATQRAARSDLTLFCTWWETKHRRAFDLKAVMDRDLRDWELTRQKVDGAAPATVNRGLSTLRRMCAWVLKQKLLADNPTKGVKDIPSFHTPLTTFPA